MQCHANTFARIEYYWTLRDGVVNLQRTISDSLFYFFTLEPISEILSRVLLILRTSKKTGLYIPSRFQRMLLISPRELSSSYRNKVTCILIFCTILASSARAFIPAGIFW